MEETNIEFDFGSRDAIKTILLEQKIGFTVYDNDRKMVIYRRFNRVAQVLDPLPPYSWRVIKP